MINKRGFTLVELIMAIIVVGIISIPISLSLGQHIRSAAVSQDYSTAINLGRFEMELVNNLAYANINSLTSANYQGYSYDVVRTVSYAQGSGATPESLKKITVDVKKSGSTTVLVSFVTYVAANVSYGI